MAAVLIPEITERCAKGQMLTARIEVVALAILAVGDVVIQTVRAALTFVTVPLALIPIWKGATPRSWAAQAGAHLSCAGKSAKAAVMVPWRSPENAVETYRRLALCSPAEGLPDRISAVCKRLWSSPYRNQLLVVAVAVAAAAGCYYAPPLGGLGSVNNPPNQPNAPQRRLPTWEEFVGDVWSTPFTKLTWDMRLARTMILGGSSVFVLTSLNVLFTYVRWRITALPSATVSSIDRPQA
jgi:hypothetical protein